MWRIWLIGRSWQEYQHIHAKGKKVLFLICGTKGRVNGGIIIYRKKKLLSKKMDIRPPACQEPLASINNIQLCRINSPQRRNSSSNDFFPACMTVQIQKRISGDVYKAKGKIFNSSQRIGHGLHIILECCFWRK